MSEEKKEQQEGCCGTTPKSGCGCCCSPKKVLFGLLVAVFIFASGMWYAKAHCQSECHMGSGMSKMCPMVTGSMMAK